MNLGENIRNLRKEKNLSQEQLAQMLNVSRQAISKWESNKAYPDIDNLILLKNIFNVSLDDLVEGGNVIKIKESIYDSNSSIENNMIYDEDEEEDEAGENFIFGGFIIGTAVGFITNNTTWCIVGGFLGMGIFYIIQDKIWSNKTK